jgi:hypothetical protein
MIRYSSYGSTNFRTPSIQIVYLDRLEVEYRKLQELREQVRKAEAADAQRKRPRSGAMPRGVTRFRPRSTYCEDILGSGRRTAAGGPAAAKQLGADPQARSLHITQLRRSPGLARRDRGPTNGRLGDPPGSRAQVGGVGGSTGGK